ncbi:RrF2 family transcriptional regulator [Nocardia stercoris]|uniref:Rrf2 family transcriptional regulator n=1 Tax=Nocardia stercoris TaxID=2483361 RepID=A0A3M2L9K4_9NOCA|nr:Rrf2 family transcriptional regulator [Nocardia stercoris]RMI34279.1 Rrf2 family transcriptional regulator [Nocardia stercoris]
MNITPKGDYAVRVLLEIATAQLAPGRTDIAVKAEAISAAQDIPAKVLETVAAELRRAGLVVSRRGPDGGYRLSRPATEISVADVIRAVEGPLASVRGQRPEDVVYTGSAVALREVWIALRVNLRAVLEQVSIAQVAAGDLPAFVADLTSDPGAWTRRPVPIGNAPATGAGSL